MINTRAWHKKRKEMFYIVFLDKMFHEVRCIPLQSYRPKWNTSGIKERRFNIFSFKPSDLITEYCTKIQDINNQCIFPNDIISMDSIIGVVTYDAPSYVLRVPTACSIETFLIDITARLEILGNIYENRLKDFLPNKDQKEILENGCQDLKESLLIYRQKYGFID